jgi:hypothetical protein
MSNIKDATPSRPLPGNRRTEEAAVDEQLEKDADEMARKGQEIQKRNEENQGIFNK